MPAALALLLSRRKTSLPGTSMTRPGSLVLLLLACLAIPSCARRLRPADPADHARTVNQTMYGAFIGVDTKVREKSGRAGPSLHCQHGCQQHIGLLSRACAPEGAMMRLSRFVRGARDARRGVQ